MNKIIIEIQHIVKCYKQNKVLQGIDAQFYQGDFTVIMGNSGSGKSTLLQILSGMDRATEGKIQYQGRDIAKATEKELTNIRAKDFGFVFQKNHLVSNLSLYENIVVSGYISGNGTETEVEKRASELIKQMNLSEAVNRFPSEVSGGEAQRAAIARAVIGKPQILFADEPTGALNKSNSIEVLDLFTRFHREGQSIILVTHDKEAALRGNRVLYLSDGKITGELNIGEYVFDEDKDKNRDENRRETLEIWLKQKGW